MARTPSLWKFREGWGDIINQEHSTKQTLIFELVPWNLKICGFLTFRLFEFCCHFSTFRTFRLLLPLFDFSDFSTFRVLLPLFDFSDFSTFAATFRLFGLFDFSSFAATFRLFDFSTFRVFFHSSHLRPWMHPGSPTEESGACWLFVDVPHFWTVSLYSMTLWYCFQILFPSNRKQNSRKAVPTMKTKTETWRIKSRKPQIWSPVFSARKMWTQCVHHPSFELGGLESLLSWSESNRNTDS